MKLIQNNKLLSQAQQWILIILRIIIGWYFLHEGLVKLLNPEWSAENLLMSSRVLHDVFQWMAANNTVMGIVNFLNAWGLTLIGLGLLLGVFARIAIYAGILILTFYYVSFLPLDKFIYGISTEGSYLLFDKSFIIIVTLVMLAFFPSTLNIGLMSLLKRIKLPTLSLHKTKKNRNLDNTVDEPLDNSRREILKQLAFIPFLGGFFGFFIGNKKFLDEIETDAITGGTIILTKQNLNQLEGVIPQGKLGEKSISRLMLGNNLIGGWAHARDLIYASQLFKAYNTEKKVFETLMLAESAGINTINLISNQLPLINSYKKIYGNNGLQTMVQVGAGHGYTKDKVIEDIDRAIDLGADIIQIWGIAGDIMARFDKTDELHECVEYAKNQGYITGIGAHDIHTFLAYDKIGIEPDFYFKTLHHDNYRSAIPKEDRVPFEVVGAKPIRNPYYDNMWCLFPEKTIEYIHKVKKPMIAYKVLAAGAIKPEEGFQYAFDNGADFICVGMFDFQIVEDANIAIHCIAKAKNRERPWYG